KRPPLIYFENGTIGVNFLGFKASAGLGGLLTGNMADGGLHAEAGTPFGQSAGAGINGNVDENGQSRGYKYSYRQDAGFCKFYRFETPWNPIKIDCSTVSSFFQIPSPITFENGNVGVNFLGFKASAGLGGLLTGNAAHGGLQASAETPFGQAAKAGLGGGVDGQGRSLGGLYAGATAGGGVSAGAGLAGDTSVEGSSGGAYAGASAGGATVVKTRTKATGFVKPIEVEKEVEVSSPLVVQKHFEISSVPVEEKQVEVVEQAKPQTTYVERTVIPNYVEKTIQVPSYVEKTIRVPTVIEKKVRVPAAPTVIEKTVAAPPANVQFEKSSVEEVIVPQPVTVVKTTKVRTRPHRLHLRKHLRSRRWLWGRLWGEVMAVVTEVATAVVLVEVLAEVMEEVTEAIPISTLGAVNKLVSGIVGGTSGSFSVSKSVGASTY
ncbi:hypothetical protein NQ315_015526, partial [Exocentrus adspersus]